MAPQSVGAGEEDEVRTVQQWTPEGRPAGAGQLRMVADPARRLLYGMTGGGSWLGAYDLDTLRLRSSLTFTGSAPQVLLVDNESGDLLVTSTQGLIGAPKLQRFGMVKGSLALRWSVDLGSSLGNGSLLIGVYRMPNTSRYWLLVTTSEQQHGLKVAELDVTEAQAATGRVNWLRDLSGECPKPLHHNRLFNAGFAYLPSGGGLYFGCGAPTTGSGTQVPQNPGVARLLLHGDPRVAPTQPGVIEKFTRPGDFTSADSIVDVPSERVVISAMNAAAEGATMYGFDARTGTWVGGTSGGTNQFTAIGFDEVNGRVYGVSQDPRYGLLVADMRPTPLPQARRYPSYYRKTTVPATMSIPVDWKTGRIFIAYSGQDQFYVVEDSVAPVPIPPGADPDSNTVDVQEGVGRTQAAYSGAAQGYGSRYRWVGGPENFFYNLTSVTTIRPEESREIRGAYLNSLTLANGEASASAIAADRDEHTAHNQRIQFGETAPEVAVAWPWRDARCVDFGGGSGVDRTHGADVECDANQRLVSAGTVFDQISHDVGVRVARSEYSARARKDDVRGVVVTITSKAENVVVTQDGHTLEIGEVRVDAEAWAKGRPGTAGTTYKRKVKDVLLDGKQQCEATCTAAELDRLGRAHALSKLTIEFPEPDRTYADGSRGGYQALIRRAPPEFLEEVVINGQPPNRVEVPGMVLVLSYDNYLRDRMIVELAAVGAEARYGISLVGNDAANPDLGGGALVPLAALGGDGTGVQSPEGLLVAGATLPTAEPDEVAAVPFDAAPISLGRTAGLIWQGVSRGLRLFPVWVVLLAPVYLTARRWLLLQRNSLRPGARS